MAPADLVPKAHVPFLSSVRPLDQAEPNLPRSRECAYDGRTRAGEEPAHAKDVAMRIVCRFPGPRLTSWISTGELKARVRALAAALLLGWNGPLRDRLRGCRLCPLLASLRHDSSTPRRRVDAELGAILHTTLGRRLTPYVVGNHPCRQSVTDFFEGGARQAVRLLPYVRPHECVLEFGGGVGGGVGRLGRVIAPHVRRLVSVDIAPIMKKWGRRLSPGVVFHDLDEVAAAPEFDGAYSIAVFFHLTLDVQKRALEYVHGRLKPGGWFLVDVRVGPRTTGPRGGPGTRARPPRQTSGRSTGPCSRRNPSPCFNSGFLMRKRDTNAGEVPIAASRRHT